MEGNKNRLVYLLQEIGIVVIGVLIAVSINNYKEKLENEKYIDKTLLAIENEIKLSKSEVDTTTNRHLQIIEYLENNIDNNAMPLVELIASQGGIQSPVIKNISLRFFISNKAELVSFDVISQLSEIETHKETLSKKLNRLIDFVYEHIDDTDRGAKIKFAYHLANVVDSEQALLELYSNFINDNKPILQSNVKQ